MSCSRRGTVRLDAGLSECLLLAVSGHSAGQAGSGGANVRLRPKRTFVSSGRFSSLRWGCLSMPYFRVRLSGTGISYPFAESDAPVIGFFTTRLVRGSDLHGAHSAAKELVLSEWQPGGSYAEADVGALPALVVEDAWSVGLLAGWFGARGGGYAFYRHDD